GIELLKCMLDDRRSFSLHLLLFFFFLLLYLQCLRLFYFLCFSCLHLVESFLERILYFKTNTFAFLPRDKKHSIAIGLTKSFFASRHIYRAFKCLIGNLSTFQCRYLDTCSIIH